MSELDEIDTNPMVPGLPANTIIKTVLKARKSTGDTVCSECEKKFTFRRDYTVSYISEKKE
jgi:hypothetical protein